MGGAIVCTMLMMIRGGGDNNYFGGYCFVHAFVCIQCQGIVPEAFKEPGTLHLTLGVLRIFSQAEEVCTILYTNVTGMAQGRITPPPQCLHQH